jgi:hypothetical protein
MATQAQTQTAAYKVPPFFAINPVMGHIMDGIDPNVICRATGSDRGDPPNA